MRMIPVESSNLKAVGYELAASRLVVEFKNGGQYAYAGVPSALVAEMLFADSVGKVFDAKVKKGGFAFEKLTTVQ